MIKSPLRYPGGKSRAVKIISELIPRFDEYREPFVGGGSVYIYLKQKYPDKKFWINDLYTNLYHFWNETHKNPKALIYQITELKEQFNEGKKLHEYLMNNIHSFEPINKAAAFFVFNRITFSGTSESGGFSNAAFNKRFTPSSIKRVQALSEILHGTKITNTDYQNVIESAGNNTFIFLDPPYYSATKSALYGKNGNMHKQFDHKRFANVLKNTKHKWLITYDDSPYIRDLFSFAYIKKWELTYGMRNVNKSNSQIGNELFISNYQCDQPVIKQATIFDHL